MGFCTRYKLVLSRRTTSLDYQSAKLDITQINEQTGVYIGKDGINFTVNGHAQFNDAVIMSEADKESIHFRTQSITSQDIENYSDLKIQSVSVNGDASSLNPMPTLSLLRNKNKESHLTTKLVLGDNIQL